MLIIRLSPTGKKGQTFFRVIVSEKAKDVFGTYLELLGNYNPHKSPPEVKLEVDRVKYWLDKGAQASPTVHNLLVDQNIIPGPKVTSWKPKKKASDPEAATAPTAAPVADAAKPAVTETPKAEAQPEAPAVAEPAAAPKAEAVTKAPKAEAVVEAPAQPVEPAKVEPAAEPAPVPVETPVAAEPASGQPAEPEPATAPEITKEPVEHSDESKPNSDTSTETAPLA